MTLVFESGVEVTAHVALQDRNGEVVVDPDSASFVVLDADEGEVSPSAVIALVGGEMEISAVVGVAANTLASGALRGYRIVEFSFVKGVNTYKQRFEYVLQGASTLIVGTNSYQTYSRAILTSMDLADADYFKSGLAEAQISSLVDAYHSIASMSFVVDGIPQPPLTELSKVQIETELNSRFLSALRRAQIVEANETMNPGSIHRKRVSGLLAESIGESSMMFRPEKVMNNQPLTRRSMVILTEWLNWNMSTGRA